MEIDFAIVYYKLNICDRMESITRRLEYIGGIPSEWNHTIYPNIITVENETVIVREYNDTGCTQYRRTSLEVKLNTIRVSKFIGEKEISLFPSYEYILLTENEPQYPHDNPALGKTWVSMTTSFTGDSTLCTGDPRQAFWVKSGECAQNWIAYGSYNEIADAIFVDCDENSMFVKITQSIDCVEDTMIFDIDMQVIKMFEQMTGSRFCFYQVGANIYVNPKCTYELPEETKQFKSKTSHMKLDFYYENDEKMCLGEPTIDLDAKLDVCSGNQLVNANDTHYLIRIYSKDDFDCEKEPTAIHFSKMDLLSVNPEKDPFCTEMWLFKFDNYFLKQHFYDDYDLNQFSRSIAMITDINCTNPDMEYIKKYKSSAFRSFWHANDDFCISAETLSILHDDLRLIDFSFKGDCRDGKLYMRNYTYNKECENIFFPVEDNGFCLENIYFTCLSYVCFEKEMYEDDVCNGNGFCVDFDVCQCNDGWEGLNCSIISTTSVAWVFPIIGSLIGAIFVIFIVSFFVFLCIIIQIGKQKKKLKDFSEIEDIDILLEESKVQKKIDDPIKTNNTNLFNLANKSFVLDWERILLEKQIASGGSSAKIYIASWGGKKVAYKIFRTSQFTDDKNYDEFTKELEFAISLRHPNILQFYGCTIKKPRIGLVMEYCQKGSIKKYFKMLKMSRGSASVISLSERLRILLEIATGMNYLKQKNVIHRDLKSDNVLLDGEVSPKIMDFGLSKQISNVNTDMTRRIGTSYYMAPEVNISKNYNYKVDMFSFGIMAWEIYYLNFNPYNQSSRSNSMVSLEMQVLNDENFRPKINIEDEEKNLEFFKLIKLCWHQKPDQRPEWENIIKTLTEIREETKDINPKPKKKFSSELKEKDYIIKDLKKKMKKLIWKEKMIKKEKNKEIKELKKKIKNN